MPSPKVFGHHNGKQVMEAVLESASASISVISFGAVIRDWRLDHGGKALPVNNGFTTMEDYANHSICHGMVAGRVANRISGGGFTLDGKRYDLPLNDGPNHLHGGPMGLGVQVWDMDTDSANNAVILSYHSPDGEMGYPGDVDFKVTVSLSGTTMTMVMEGMPDRPTPINLAQHTYYNLNGTGQVRDHRLWIDADRYTKNDDVLIPTGEMPSVEGQLFDFRTPATFRDRDPEGTGVDINLILNERDTSSPSARVIGDQTGIELKLWTEEPGLQLFNAPLFTYDCLGHDGERYGPFSGICLEAQHFPDSVNQPTFPSIIRTPETPYYQKLVVDISA